MVHQGELSIGKHTKRWVPVARLLSFGHKRFSKSSASRTFGAAEHGTCKQVIDVGSRTNRTESRCLVGMNSQTALPFKHLDWTLVSPTGHWRLPLVSDGGRRAVDILSACRIAAGSPFMPLNQSFRRRLHVHAQNDSSNSDGGTAHSQDHADGGSNNDHQCDPQKKVEDPAVNNLGKEIAELRDRLLRCLADGENTRMRHSREMDTLRRFATMNFAKSLLDVADNLSLTIQHIEQVVRQGQQSDSGILKGILQSILMTRDSLHKTFTDYGIEDFSPEVGDLFDPEDHEAIFQVHDKTRNKGEVYEVITRGYRMHDRVIRPSKVSTTK